MSEDATPQNPEAAAAGETPAPEPAEVPAAPEPVTVPAGATAPTWSASSEGVVEAPTQPVGTTVLPPGDAAPPPSGPPAAPVPAAVPAGGPPEPTRNRRTAIVAGLLVLVLALGGGFAIGRATADSGPSSLADAVHRSANGDLPLGNTNKTMQQLLQQLERNGGLQGLLRGLLGQLGRNGTGNGNGNNVLPLNPGNGNNNGNGNGGNNATPQNPTTGQAFLGVQIEASGNGQGVVIGSVESASPAADSGLKAGDVITAVDGTTVNTAAALSSAIRAHQPGDSVKITYTRGGTSADVQVRLGNRSSATSTPTAPPA